MKQALKIKLANHSQFQNAWNALIKLGYHCPKDLVPHTAPYLYTYEDGRIRADYFDVEGADLSSPNSALGYFTTETDHKEITLDELLGLAKQDEHEPFYDYIPLIKQERPLFEANYVKNGGDLQYLKWDECDDGAGSYQADWEAISEADIDDPEFDEEIQEHANHVTSCLHSWVECAKSKAIPDGWILAPKEPNEKQKRTAMFITASNGNAIDAYKGMLADLDVSSK